MQSKINSLFLRFALSETLCPLYAKAGQVSDILSKAGYSLQEMGQFDIEKIENSTLAVLLANSMLSFVEINQIRIKCLMKFLSKGVGPKTCLLLAPDLFLTNYGIEIKTEQDLVEFLKRIKQ